MKLPAAFLPAVRRPLLLMFAVAVLLSLFPATAARAEPTTAEIEAMIDKQWQQLESTIEQYNKVRVQLKENQKKATALGEKIEPLSLQADLALARIGEMAAQYYKTGPLSNVNALLATGSPTTIAEQLAYLDRLARHQEAQIADVTAVRNEYAEEKAKLDALIEQEKKQQAELAARKKQIDAEIKRLQSMLPKSTVKAQGCPTITGVPGDKAPIAVRVACEQVGDPYVWGAAGPDAFDCSGLTQYAWGKAGVYLPHYTGSQWNTGRAISQSEALPGDLVFFYSDLHHVGLYIGNGQMVHAPTAGRPVTVASIYNMPVAGFRRVG